MKKRILALLLAAILLLSLSACGGKAAPSAPAEPTADAPAEPGYLGKYQSVQGEMFGMTLSGEEMAGFDIELKAGGSGVLTIDGDACAITYTVAGDALTIEVEGEQIVGTVGDDLIYIDDMFGLGMSLTFAREGSEAANPENWLDTTTQALLGTWTSYQVVDIMEEDASAAYDPAGLVLEIRADGTMSTYWEGQSLGDEEWDLFGGSCFLDNGVSFSFNDDETELTADFSNYDLCDEYLTYTLQKTSSER